MLKRTFSGLQHCCWQYGSIFIRLIVVASLVCEISRNSPKIRTYSSSRSSQVIDLGVNWKRTGNFPLVSNSNFGRISDRFQDIDAFSSKKGCFSHATLVWRLLALESPCDINVLAVINNIYQSTSAIPTIPTLSICLSPQVSSILFSKNVISPLVKKPTLDKDQL